MVMIRVGMTNLVGNIDFFGFPVNFVEATIDGQLFNQLETRERERMVYGPQLCSFDR